jgi:hypothetical protein
MSMFTGGEGQQPQQLAGPGAGAAAPGGGYQPMATSGGGLGGLAQLFTGTPAPQQLAGPSPSTPTGAPGTGPSDQRLKSLLEQLQVAQGVSNLVGSVQGAAAGPAAPGLAGRTLPAVGAYRPTAMRMRR